MEEIAGIVGRLIALLVFKGILSNTDKEYIMGNITEAEWIEEDSENDN